MTRSQSTPQSSQLIWLEARVKELEGECGIDQRNAAASQRESALLLDKCEELAAQVDAMREVISELVELETDIRDGIHDSFTFQPARMIIALPNTAAAILRQRDARIAAQVLRDYVKMIPGGSIVDPQLIADDMRRLADQLEMIK